MTIEYFLNNWTNIKEEDIDFTVEEWKDISLYEYLPEEFMEKYQDKVYWNYISTDQNLSEEFIEKYEDKVDWSGISYYQKFSEEFIEKYKHKVDWSLISERQSLSEEFIERYKDKVDWTWIPKSQNLSMQFIFKYQDKIRFSDYPRCLRRCFRLKYGKYHKRSCSTFSICSNNNYAIITYYRKRINIQTIPANIIFCHTL